MGDKLRQRLSAGQTSAGAGAHSFTQYRHVRTVVQSSKVRLCRLWLNVVRSSGPSRRPGSLANGRSSAFLYISTRDHAFGSFSSSFDRFFAAETVRPSGCHLRTAELEPESLLGPRARLTASTASLGCPSDGKLPKVTTYALAQPNTPLLYVTLSAQYNHKPFAKFEPLTFFGMNRFGTDDELVFHSCQNCRFIASFTRRFLARFTRTTN